MQRVQSYSAPGITVTFDPELCIHSAVCLRALPMVFDVRRRRWIAPEAASPEQVAAAVRRCGGTGNAPFCDGTHRTNGFRPRTPAARGQTS